MNAPASAPSPRLAVKPPPQRPLISLTPLLDVVFILLVFYMLASIFLQAIGRAERAFQPLTRSA